MLKQDGRLLISQLELGPHLDLFVYAHAQIARLFDFEVRDVESHAPLHMIVAARPGNLVVKGRGSSHTIERELALGRSLQGLLIGRKFQTAPCDGQRRRRMLVRIDRLLEMLVTEAHSRLEVVDRRRDLESPSGLLCSNSLPVAIDLQTAWADGTEFHGAVSNAHQRGMRENGEGHETGKESEGQEAAW